MDRGNETYSKSISIYTERPNDDQAVYLTPENFPVKADGLSDDTDAIQQAILKVQEKSRYGIVFIPEGTYRITRTIYIGKACRLIGYGKNRPVIVLGKDTPGFQTADPKDKGEASYLFWFTDRVPKPGEDIRDANPGTFYSALTNIDIRIEEGNPAAVALRTHFAQHSFVSHVDIHIGSGKAGIFDVGNEIEDVRFFGGDYGIYTTKPSPGWQFMMVDTLFEGQRKAAIRTKEAGLTIVRMKAKTVPTVIETEPDYYEKLYMEDCLFEDVTGPSIIIDNENNAFNQINLRNVDCIRVPTLAAFRQSVRTIAGKGGMYKVKAFVHGSQMDDLKDKTEIRTTVELNELAALPGSVPTDIPNLPLTGTWSNIKAFGAKGDGVTDDTAAFREAIDKSAVIYLPQGFYRVTDTLLLKAETVLIGLNPISTRILLVDNTEAFGGFGPPKPLLDVPKGGTNSVTGIGIDAGARNPRAVGCRWMAGPASYMNDVKFYGCHGSMNPDGDIFRVYNPSRTGDYNNDLKWDAQYWSLWITNGGGGVFKDVWTASTYASSGCYISDTATQGRIYAMSVEHHVRNEIRFKNVSNWKVYALQLEEEVAESPDCQPLEIENCENMVFANLYFFRVIWVANPYPQAIRTWHCKDVEFLNVHNFAQTKYPFENTLFDMDTNTVIRPWEFARLRINGRKTPRPVITANVERLAKGFEMVDAICKDSKGNIYLCDSRMKRIFKWSAEKEQLELLTDSHYKPLSLACDTQDNLLVVVEYLPPVGATVNGKPEIYTKGPDAEGTSYSFWYSKGATVRVCTINPNEPDTSMKVLEKVPVKQISKVSKALYPANRWRDSGDYLEVTVNQAEFCYLAPDGVTIIPDCYDLMRAVCLIEAIPGKPVLMVDEYFKRTLQFEVDSKGFLSNPTVFAEQGETNVTVSQNQEVFIPDGEVNLYDSKGTRLGEIEIPERPSCVIVSDDGKSLYVTARSSLYRVSLS